MGKTEIRTPSREIHVFRKGVKGVVYILVVPPVGYDSRKINRKGKSKILIESELQSKLSKLKSGEI